MTTRSVHKENSKAWWDEKYRSVNGMLYDKAPSSFVTQNAEGLAKGAKVLDLACGEGRNSVALAAMGYAVTALDFSEVALERARHLAAESGVSVTFKAVDLDLYLPELLSFDAMVISNFKPAKTLLTNVSRGLKQNGFLLIEGYLMAAAKARPGVIESFECFTPNDLLRQFVPGQAAFKILSYSEWDSGRTGEKVTLIAQKSGLL